ncbi:tail fiber protein [Burkholderia ubonensis]|uniref:tail fiber protein n=1 Tax=Burkholderia ubonensis TaxID=101571 RepID=UPI000AD037E2|nr:tail fiber protein [Burkholderia ubonensis]
MTKHKDGSSENKSSGAEASAANSNVASLSTSAPTGLSSLSTDAPASSLGMRDVADSEFVGPPVSVLKHAFRSKSIPLQMDFFALIDVADCGRLAAGLSPGQPGGTGAGLYLDPEQRLAVLARPNQGLDVNAAGVGVVPNTNKAVEVSGSGVGVVANAAKGIEVDASGVGLAPDQQFRRGMIMMFTGSTIPTGWTLCDGTNGAPDLRNKFILGGSGSEVEQNGGSAISGSGGAKGYNAYVNSASAEEIAASSGQAALNQSQIPAHYHLDGLKGNSYPGINDFFQYGYARVDPQNTPLSACLPRIKISPPLNGAVYFGYTSSAGRGKGSPWS